MKSLILIALATLLVCNSAFAFDKPTSGVAPETRSASTEQADTEASAGRPLGIDLSNVPKQLRWLVLYAWMVTHQSLSVERG